MCEHCDNLDTLLRAVNSGLRKMDPATGVELATLSVKQAQTPLVEALANLDGTAREEGDDIDAIWRVANTLDGLARGAAHNAVMLGHLAVHLRREQRHKKGGKH